VYRKLVSTMMAILLAGCFTLPSPSALAQSQQKVQGQSQGGNAGAQRGGGGNVVAPSGGARTFTPNAPRTVTPSTTPTYTPSTTRMYAPSTARTVTPSTTRVYAPNNMRIHAPDTAGAVTPSTDDRTHGPSTTRMYAPGTNRTVTPSTARIYAPSRTRTYTMRAARTVSPSEVHAQVTAGRLRNMPMRHVGWTTIRGKHYSVWRGGYRVHHRHGWSTFVTLGALSALAIGADYYYPYAYLSAPEPYCEGQTEDGCLLMWQPVQTLEGYFVNQCVAYCPWQ